jgi:hypothetical protein
MRYLLVHKYPWLGEPVWSMGQGNGVLAPIGARSIYFHKLDRALLPCTVPARIDI